MGSGIQPGKAAAEGLDLQLAGLKEFLVDGGDFQLAPGARFDMGSHIYHPVGIEVQAHDRIMGFGLFRLFLNAEAVPVDIEFGHAISFGVTDPVAEYRGFPLLFSILHRTGEQFAEAVAVEDVVAQHQAGAVVADEFFSNDECLGKAVRRGLLRI